MSESPAPLQPDPTRDKSAWPKAIAWMVIIFLFLASGIFIFKSLRDLPGEIIEKSGTAMEKSGRALKEIAAAFNQGTITTSFSSYATSLNSNHYLQFATLRQNEIFTRTDEATTGFGYIALPDVIVEARAPVAYTYYVDFNARWDFLLQDGVIQVLAPPIRFNEPAVDASEITYEVKKGSVFRNTDQAKENLKKSVMPMVHRRAKENVMLVRENGRRAITEFVDTWLAKSFSDTNKYFVKVYFQDEKLPANLQGPKIPSEKTGTSIR